MKTIRTINLNTAEASFAVANTPLFLLRKLRADTAASEISRLNASDAILADLRKALQKIPVGFSEAVVPYVLLVALSYKADAQFLRAALKERPVEYPWYSYIGEALLQAFRPTLKSDLRTLGSQNLDQTSVVSSTSNNEIVVLKRALI